MFKKILIALVLIVAGFAAYVALQPDEYRIERTATMAAAPAEVFEQVNDFHKWDAWSPWVKIDPHCKVAFEGPASGEGAIFRWDGNNEVGQGSMTILESKPNELVRIRLDFEKPMKDTATTEFTFKTDGGRTVTTWSMYGRRGFVGKAICSIMNMEKMVGGKYEEGLSSMKAIVEGKPLPHFPNMKGIPLRVASPTASGPVPTGATGQEPLKDKESK